MDKSTLKQIRKELNLTQEEFSERLNISVHRLQSWEQGKRNVPLHMYDLIEQERNKTLIDHKLAMSTKDLRLLFNEKISEIIDFILENEEKFSPYKKWKMFLEKRYDRIYRNEHKPSNQELIEHNKDILITIQVLYNNEDELQKYKLFRDWIENKELKAINRELNDVSSKIQP